MLETNPYYGYFRELSGRGNGEYYTGIGQIYKSRRGLQRGYGFFMPGTPVGSRRGLGIANIFKSLFKIATPILKNVGSRAVDLLSGTAKDVLQGSNVKESFMKHGRDAASKLIADAPGAFSGFITREGPSDDVSSYGDSEEEGVHTRVIPRKRRKVISSRIRARNNNKRLKSQYPALQYL